MKQLVFTALFIAAFLSCKKEISTTTGSVNGPEDVSENAVFPLACHSTSFVTNYAVQAGKVPPFRFTKTQYASGRIRTINMLSRANPIHAAFKPQAWEVIGTWTYDLKNEAYFVGTKKLWEYYKSSTGAAAKRSIIKKNVSLTFYFHPKDDDPESTGHYFQGDVKRVYNNIEKKDALEVWAFGGVEVLPGSDEPEALFNTGSQQDNSFVIETLNTSNYTSKKKITFNLNLSTGWNKNPSYQPTQNWVSLEYSMCEVMQWLNQFQTPSGERSSVAVEFYPYNTSYKAVQSQVYKNHKYDSKLNLLSYSYGDNVLQKTTWVCK